MVVRGNHLAHQAKVQRRGGIEASAFGWRSAG
jgi:hypothetical protein